MTDQRSLPPELYTEEYFLNACEGFEEFTETQGERLSRRLSAAFAVAAVRPGMRVLDVGCGRGEILRHCARLGADAFGVDYAVVAVDMASKAVAGESQSPGKTGVAQADAKRLPFPSAYFDRVLMFDVVEHLYPWELDQSLAEIRRVLKPGGAFIVHRPQRLVRPLCLPAGAPGAARDGAGRALPGEPARAQRQRQRRRARQRAEPMEPGSGASEGGLPARARLA